MTSAGPETGHRCPNDGIVFRCVSIHVACVCDLSLGSRVDAVDLARGEILQVRHAESIGQGIYACMLEQLVAGLVDRGNRWIDLERSLAWYLLGEVIASIEELEEAADSFEVVR